MQQRNRDTTDAWFECETIERYTIQAQAEYYYLKFVKSSDVKIKHPKHVENSYSALDKVPTRSHFIKLVGGWCTCM